MTSLSGQKRRINAKQAGVTYRRSAIREDVSEIRSTAHSLLARPATLAISFAIGWMVGRSGSSSDDDGEAERDTDNAHHDNSPSAIKAIIRMTLIRYASGLLFGALHSDTSIDQQEGQLPSEAVGEEISDNL